MKWTYYSSFDDFTPRHLHDVLKLRQEIFIIEQECIYNDIDGLDDVSEHLLLFNSDEILIGYLRIVPAGSKFEECSLGRIAIKHTHRGQGLGKTLVRKGIEIVEKAGVQAVRIEAQAHLEKFYEDIRFRTVSDIYIVDDIPHLQMILTS
ncbi:GNAT family N-acetyltransferase [Rhodohalobacter sp. 8-1]|uniref:GNAT family N-acetyltransferase n=1 Tax=Rhodohalobacter sp. 8-1 TaxID=3131972 RepID=UPI0030EC5811